MLKLSQHITTTTSSHLRTEIHVSKTDLELKSTFTSRRHASFIGMLVPDSRISVFGGLVSDVPFKWIHTQYESALTKHSHLRQGHHPKLHYLPLNYIPLISMVFKNAEEEDWSSVTGFQEEMGRHRRRRRGCCERKNDNVVKLRRTWRKILIIWGGGGVQHDKRSSGMIGLSWDFGVMRFSFNKKYPYAHYHHWGAIEQGR